MYGFVKVETCLLKVCGTDFMQYSKLMFPCVIRIQGVGNALYTFVYIPDF